MDGDDFNRPAMDGVKEEPAWNCDLSLSHDGRESLTIAKKDKSREKKRKRKGIRQQQRERMNRGCAGGVITYYIISIYTSLGPARSRT